MIYRMSCYKFSNKEDIPFSAVDYSKFKFGHKDVTRKYGKELADAFIKKSYPTLTQIKKFRPTAKIVVMSSPYSHIVTATFGMKDYFVRHLNNQLVEDGFEPIVETKISRLSTYKADYGQMSKEDRLRIIKDDSFHVDKSLLNDNICIFLDDIIITGSHEIGIRDMLRKKEIDSLANFFLYFAELTDDKCDPTIENYLNYAFVKNLVSLDKIIKNGSFLMNTRVVKYILNADHEECKVFLTYQKNVLLHTLYHNAIGNSYHLIPDYQTNLNYLKSLIQ